MSDDLIREAWEHIWDTLDQSLALRLIARLEASEARVQFLSDELRRVLMEIGTDPDTFECAAQQVRGTMCEVDALKARVRELTDAIQAANLNRAAFEARVRELEARLLEPRPTESRDRRPYD